MTRQPLLIQNARILDPASRFDNQGDLLVLDGKIAARSLYLDPADLPEGTCVIDAEGLALIPGLIDLAVHSGEPGAEHRETLASLSAAAAAGGVTTALLMPNTIPTVDSPALVDFILRRARATASIKLLPAAALTRGLAGKEMTEIGLLGEAGAPAFTDGLSSLDDAGLMLRLMNYAANFDALLMHHVLDKSLVGEGVMNLGEFSTRLGLTGSHTVAERLTLERDLALAEVSGARYHAMILTAEESLAPLKRAKKAGLEVTAGTSINHLSLNELEVGTYRTFFKLNPPLRAETDRQALIDGLREGIIDVIVSGHDPQDVEAKRLPFAEAEFGAIGIETMLPTALRLYHNEQLTLLELLAAMTCKPADLLGLPQGRLSTGAPADLALVDLDVPWVVKLGDLASRSRNSPFEDARMSGKVQATWVDGALVYAEDKMPDRANQRLEVSAP